VLLRAARAIPKLPLVTGGTLANAAPSVTQLLAQARAGDAAARDAAFALVYEELKRLAHRQLMSQRAATLGTTALVHEAYVRLSGADCTPQDRRHFIALGARAMRFVLIDHARRAMAQKRDGEVQTLSISGGIAGSDSQASASDVLALDQALERLGALDARLAQVVEWRFFGGLSEPEIAEELGLTERTVQRDWRRARAFLHRELAAAGAA
jgi:RNA polymerase sigma factor (TIGR02999 family)